MKSDLVKSIICNLIAVAGIVCFFNGLWKVWPPVALMGIGVALVVMAFVLRGRIR